MTGRRSSDHEKVATNVEDLNAIREAGFSDGEVAEIVANVALNVFTNYFNLVAGTEVDLPQVPDVTKGAAYACGA